MLTLDVAAGTQGGCSSLSLHFAETPASLLPGTSQSSDAATQPCRYEMKAPPFRTESVTAVAGPEAQADRKDQAHSGSTIVTVSQAELDLDELELGGFDVRRPSRQGPAKTRDDVQSNNHSSGMRPATMQPTFGSVATQEALQDLAELCASGFPVVWPQSHGGTRAAAGMSR